MYIYRPRKSRDEYDGKSSIISIYIMLFFLAAVFVFPVIFIPEKINIQKNNNKISTAVLKRIYNVPQPSMKAVPEKINDEAAEQETEKIKKPLNEPDKNRLEEYIEDCKEETSDTNVPDDISESANTDEIVKTSISEKNIIIAELVKLINKKKRYPASARRRNITGTVEIVIYINSSSEISEYSIASYDSRILKNSAESVMKKLMNIKLSTGLSEGFSVKVPVKYILK